MRELNLTNSPIYEFTNRYFTASVAVHYAMSC